MRENTILKYTKIYEQYRSGSTMAEISNGNKSMMHCMSYYFRKLGFPTRSKGKQKGKEYNKPLKQEYEKAREAYLAGKSIAQIAREKGTSRQAVHRFFKIRGWIKSTVLEDKTYVIDQHPLKREGAENLIIDRIYSLERQLS